jgi:hypothetical protein
MNKLTEQFKNKLEFVSKNKLMWSHIFECEFAHFLYGDRQKMKTKHFLLKKDLTQ